MLKHYPIFLIIVNIITKEYPGKEAEAGFAVPDLVYVEFSQFFIVTSPPQIEHAKDTINESIKKEYAYRNVQPD
jgi:hypothetical protein